VRKILISLAAIIAALGLTASVAQAQPPATLSLSGTAAQTASMRMANPIFDEAMADGVFTIGTCCDSITMNDTAAAPGVPGPSYRVPLGQLLTQAGVPNQFVVLAHSGWTCADWASPVNLAALKANAMPNLTPRLDLLIVNCGTNDGKFSNLYAPGVIDANLNAIYAGVLSVSPSIRVLPTYIQYSAGYTGWQYGQGLVNDGVWRQTTNSNLAPRLITPAVGLGFIPETAAADGVHPGSAGFALYAGYFYRALRTVYGWPDISPVPCGQDGHRINDPAYPQGTYVAYNSPTASCDTSWGTK
jgi:hypothetical protein